MLEKIRVQWHPKNVASPDAFKPQSSKKVWWRCDKGHEWEAIIASRTNGAGCPYCSHRKTPKEASLATLFPNLALAWHPSLNQHITPALVTPGSNKKVWWLCSKSKQHVWKTAIGARCRGKGTGCPYCSNRKADQSNNLSTHKPNLASEWHPTLNGNLTPHQVTFSSGRKVWWLCTKGHAWQDSIYYRTKYPSCPSCTHRRVNPEYNLAFCYPDVAKEFHPTKNGLQTPEQFMPRTNTRLWWLCVKGHEWQAAISARTSGGTQCPYCFSQTSRMELRIYSELKTLFLNAIHRYKDGEKNYEIDIYLPEIKVGIEVDSKRYHDNPKKQAINIRKNEFFNSTGNILIRVRELSLPTISNHDLSFPFKFKDHRQRDVINSILIKIMEIIKLDSATLLQVRSYLEHHDWLDDGEYRQLIDNGKIPPVSFSLATRFPKVAQEWHPALNTPLTPEKVTVSSGQKVFWLCKKGHEWQAVISARTKGSRCPFCQGSRPTDENNLRAKYPDIAAQFHPDKNGNLMPEKILPNSHKKVWWLCARNHEWQATAASRTTRQSGCPDCTKKRVSEIYNLAISYPLIAHEWHPTLNEPLMPNHVTPGSKKKVYWLCNKTHVFQATINNRTSNQSKCPYCANKKISSTNNLMAKCPEVASEWHYNKNIDLTPYDVLSASNKKVWWLCRNKHEWQASIYNRTITRSGCPYCPRQLKAQAKWRSFEEARLFVRTLNLQGVSAWKNYCKKMDKPEDIPSNPNRTYNNLGWQSWNDWLGTVQKRVSIKKFRPFPEAKKFARTLNIKTLKEWQKYCVGGNKPKDIPSNPAIIYKNQVWISWGDWLGVATIATKNRRYRSFEEAKDFVHLLGLQTVKKWLEYCRNDLKPDDIPSDPMSVYKTSGWTSWGDWLGTGK